MAAGSYHGNHLTLDYTRKDWLPIRTVDEQTIAIKRVLALAPMVIRSNVPHPTRDLLVITIGEDVVLRMALQIPVSTNANFTVNVHGNGFLGIAGHITKVGRNLKSLHKQIEGAGK